MWNNKIRWKVYLFKYIIYLKKFLNMKYVLKIILSVRNRGKMNILKF